MVQDNPALAQDSSPVLDSARPSSSTPVKQEGTATQTLQVSAEVHMGSRSEQNTADVNEGPVGALSRMSLGTQVGNELSHQRDSSQSPLRSTGGKSVLCLKADRGSSRRPKPRIRYALSSEAFRILSWVGRSWHRSQTRI